MSRLVIFATLLIFVTGRNVKQKNLEPKIVGGKDAKIEDHPYQLSLEVDNAHNCGATLIAPNIALTAAHCTDDYKNTPHRLSVRAGTASIANKDGETAKVLSICQHSNFDFPDYDVSVLKLERNLPINAKIRHIAIQEKNVEIPVRTEGTVSGWGALSNEGGTSDILQTVRVPKIDQKQCETYYEEGDDITERMFCFGYEQGGKDSCQGDSGGPLVVNGKLSGIISWGYGCAYERLPGVYVNIANGEIHSHIEQCIAKFK